MPNHSRDSVFDHPDFEGHEQVIFCSDPESGLRAIIAIHDTTLGPALGGTRMWSYENETAALGDVLRLSRAMTYKNAITGVNFGGGKAVIIGDPERDKSTALLHAYARHVERLGGRFVTGEDVGIKLQDADVMGAVCEHVHGTSRSRAGDPSRCTSLGVLSGIMAAAAYRKGRTDLKGLSVCVQGLGSVGMRLCSLLNQAGVRLAVADIRQDLVGAACERFDATPVAAPSAHAADVDIFAPCALGGILNERTIPEIKAWAVVGSANAQLETATDGIRLQQRGILYAPDYVINAGGVLSIAHDMPGYDPERLQRDVLRLGSVLTQIFERADATNDPTSAIADRMVEERLARARGGIAA
jgi:leucine dehydrogenase